MDSQINNPKKIAAPGGNQITDDEYEQLDKLHYRVENGLLKLIESL
jgi:hypothetical protein